MTKQSKPSCELTIPVRLFLPIFLLLVLLSCISLEENFSYEVNSENFSYQLDSPDENYTLPAKLGEISGLDHLEKKIMLCVQDEEGTLFFYDLKKQTIIREIKFKKTGDYEGVAHIGNIAYVVQSDGDLFPVPMNNGDEVEIEKTSTILKGSNDVEGLCAGHGENTLYMACKGNPEVNKNNIKGRAIYEYNTRNKRLNEKPVINLTSSEFRDWLKKYNLNPRNFMPYKPSGIAIHPTTGDIFIIASVGQLLIVLGEDGKLVSLAPLKKSLLRQPEGISFDEKGNLYISSEGRGKPGYILSFEAKKIKSEN